MATDLASLVIGLRADVATLQSDLGKASALNKRYAKSAVDDWNSAAADIGKAIGAAVAAVAGIGAVMAKQAIDAADGFNKMSQKVGISVESLSALNVQAKLSDVSIDGLQGGLAKLARNAADAAGGSKQSAAAFSAMGVSIKDGNGNLRSTQDILQAVADKFSTYGDSAAKTALAQKLFGKAGADLIPLLNQLGDQGFKKVREEAEKYGAVISGDAAKASEEFNDNLTKLKLETQGFANSVTAQLLPGLNKFTGAMVKAGETNNQYGDTATTVSNALKGIVLALLAAKETVVGLVTVVLGLGDVIGAAGDLFNGFAKAVGNDLTAVGEAMRGNFTAARTALNSAGQNLSAGWETASQRVRGAWEAVKLGVGDAVGNTKKAYNDLFGAFSNVAAGSDTTAKRVRNLNAPLVDNADAAKEAAKALEDYASAQNAAGLFLSKLQGGLDPLNKAYQDYVKNVLDANKISQQLIATGAAAGHATEAYAQAQAFMAKAVGIANVSLDEQLAKLKKQGDVLGNYLDEVKKTNALIGLSDREKAIASAVEKVTAEYKKNTEAGIRNKQSLEAVAAGASAAAAASFDLAKHASIVEQFVSQFGDVSEFEKFKEGIEEVGKALDEAIGAGATDKVKELQRTLGGIRQSMVDGIVHSSQDGLRSIQSMTESGSKAFQAMQIAIDALTVVQAISAVLNQGQGDPYTAFARMAAMAAAVIALGVDIGNFGGGGSPSAQSAEVRQSQQGTGTVLGDANAKSESIAKATQITANATTQLVGLNRGMLTALQALQEALGAAGNQLARGAGNAQFAGIGTAGNSFLDPLGADPIMGAIGGWLFGGDQKIIDQGITIAGGALNDMLNNIVVGAYQTIQTDGGLFGSDSTDQQIVDISSEFGKQFQLVIQSIADTVREGATALGLLPADIESAMAAYQVAAVNISLQGLSAEDQQKALEAVFSSIFDGLAGAVVPFIDQFQKVGEGLGETLVRIATEVQVAQEAFKQLGLAVAETDPEKFAQISDSLIAAAGGLDDFISGMQSFVANFSSSAHQLDVSSAALTSAFEQVGLTVPMTRDGMWDLMQSLDATTEAGQAQIATLLRLSDTANAYYNQLDEFSSLIGLGGESDLHRQLISVRDAAISLLGALSKAGASTETLQHVYDASVNKINELIAQMQASAQSLAFSLGLTTHGSLDDVNAEIARLEGVANNSSSSVQNFGNAMQEAAQRASNAIDLLLGDLSPLNDQAKLQTALAGLRAGTVTQDQVLQIGRRLYASSQQYTDLFNMVRSMGGTAVSAAGGGGSHGGLTAAEQARLSDLLKQQQALQATSQLQQYQDLAQQIAEIASAKGEDWRQVVADMGINIADFEAGLKLTDQGTADLIKHQQDMLDDNNQNAKSIIDALNEGFDAVVTTLGGTPGAHGQHGTDDGGTTGSTTNPRGGHSSRDYQAGQDIYRGFRDGMTSSQPRSGRARARA